MRNLKSLAVATVILVSVSVVGGAVSAQSKPDISSPAAVLKIREIQSALKMFGFYKGPVDGTVGSSTLSAVKQFSSFVRDKGWSNASGAVAENELKGTSKNCA